VTDLVTGNWAVVARKEFEDTIRSRWLIALSALFVFVVGAAVYVEWWIQNSISAGGPVSSVAIHNGSIIREGIVTTFLPIVALVLSYGAVVGERESGSLKLLLALPHSRADVVVGKVAGRGAALAVALVAAFVLPAVVFLVDGRFAFEGVAYVQYVVFVVLLGLAFVSIGVGASAAVESNRLAIAVAIGVFLVFVILLGGVRTSLGFIGFLGSGSLPLSADQISVVRRVLRLLNPAGAFKLLTSRPLGAELFAGENTRRKVSALLMLLAWVVVPPLLGLLRFEEADL
jgi:ABC-2 type transport system permease protein